MRLGRMTARSTSGAFTLVEAVFAGVLISILFLAVMRSSITALKSARQSRHHMAAINMIQQQVETVQGMDYYRIGIHTPDHMAFVNRSVLTNEVDVDTFHPGTDVPMLSRVVLDDRGTPATNDDVHATLTTYAWAVDDAFDGLGVKDADSNTRDYKRIRVEIAWTDMGAPHSRAVETIAYGIISDDVPYSATGGGVPPPGSGDEPGIVEVVKAEYSTKDKDLKVEATEDGGEGASTLTVVGYGVMKYDEKKDKYTYSNNNAAAPGATITVTSSGGGTHTFPVTFKK